MKIKIKRDEFGIIDLKKYFFDILVNSEKILQKVPRENIIFYEKGAFRENENIILIHYAGGNTSAYGIREENYQLDIFATSMEDVEKIKNTIIFELNRKKEFGIFVKLESIAPDIETPKINYFRKILIFSLTTKDINF
ncbi:hypothetical protein DLH72_02175 [Candidatus Gracilibacteria bacterium]|nr:MAG: hypothetical protein DLH72_02175 [Candidatus Gracilibacteria bacterium]